MSNALLGFRAAVFAYFFFRKRVKRNRKKKTRARVQRTFHTRTKIVKENNEITLQTMLSPPLMRAVAYDSERSLAMRTKRRWRRHDARHDTKARGHSAFHLAIFQGVKFACIRRCNLSLGECYVSIFHSHMRAAIFVAFRAVEDSHGPVPKDGRRRELDLDVLRVMDDLVCK